MLNLQPIDLYVKGLAAKGALRLRDSKLWKQTNHGHASVMKEMGKLSKNLKPLLTQQTDYTVTYLRFKENIKITIPTKEDWDQNSIIKEDEISIFTDGSKTIKGTGAGVYSEQLGVQKSYRLKNDCNILQAEILAIEKAARLAQLNNVMSCREALSWIHNSEVGLCWVPGHNSVEGNIKADELAKLGAEKDSIEAISHPLPTINVIKTTIDRAIERWTRKTKKLLNYRKIFLSTITGVVTGHCAVGVNLKRWGKTKDNFCRECCEEEETISHLGHSFLVELDEAAGMDIGKITNFAKSWKCFQQK
ncbi:uncharacterized protein LOC103316144 [Nasonia vitripennis]|uniref:RNase H type-1 domain-containing protein n=1 Tax=Nasonia vitripennis TaxID=7425 RepID=A0A7M7QJ00_NASVI|nr:uncharacterized protein LOC103316144 [Nasonia vitripennis]